jgi:hypothetical protein
VGGGERVDPLANGPLRVLEHGGIAVELEAHVGGRAQRVELERELLGIRGAVELSGALGRADDVRERATSPRTAP